MYVDSTNKLPVNYNCDISITRHAIHALIRDSLTFDDSPIIIEFITVIEQSTITDALQLYLLLQYSES